MGSLESYKRNLPHLLPPGARLLLTCRLAGSLPVQVIQDLQKEFAAPPNRLETDEDAYARQRRYFGRFDDLLARAVTGPTWLNHAEVAQQIMALLMQDNGVRYDVHACCVMPNHLHVVLTTALATDARPFLRYWQAFKGHSARVANRMLNRQGSFWQAETYDHVIRDDAELGRIVRYTVFNPVKAGLCRNWVDWPYTYLQPDWHADMLLAY